MHTPIKVSTIFPGYIRTELNEGAKKLPFEVDEKTGSKALVKAIEKEPVKICTAVAVAANGHCNEDFAFETCE